MREMVAFVRVVESGSFSAAARQLGTTPSAVSKQIARLEAALATRLLERSTRKLRLTDGGREAYQRCRQLAAAARSVMEMSGQSGDEPEGLLRVSVPKAVGYRLLHPHIPSFLRRYPRVDVQLLLDDGEVDLIDGNVDLAIRVTDQPPAGLAGRPWRPIRHRVCATPAYLARNGAPTHPRELAGHSCICLSEDSFHSRWRFRRGDEELSVPVRGRYMANHSAIRLEAVLADLGIGSLPDFVAEAALAAGDIVETLPEWTFLASYHGTAWLLYSPGRYRASRLRVFIDHLLAAQPTATDGGQQAG